MNKFRIGAVYTVSDKDTDFKLEIIDHIMSLKSGKVTFIVQFSATKGGILRSQIYHWSMTSLVTFLSESEWVLQDA